MTPDDADPFSAARRLAVIVAHPDDETFGCGSLLLAAHASGLETMVICATRGEAGELAPGVEAPDGIGRLREDELRGAAAVLGVGEVALLDFADSGMDGEPQPGSLCHAAVEEVRARLESLVDRFQPDLVITLDGADGHRDHLRVRAAVEHLVQDGPAALYLHTLPRSLMQAWVRQQSGATGAAAYTELPEIGTPDDQITTVLDTHGYRARRDAAIAVHRSQHSPFEGLPADLQRAFLEREHLIRVR